MIQDQNATYFFQDGAVFITTVAPGPCGCCGTSTHCFVNRNGRTVAAVCDGRRFVAKTEIPVGDDGGVQQAFASAIV